MNFFHLFWRLISVVFTTLYRGCRLCSRGRGSLQSQFDIYHMLLNLSRVIQQTIHFCKPGNRMQLWRQVLLHLWRTETKSEARWLNNRHSAATGSCRHYSFARAHVFHLWGTTPLLPTAWNFLWQSFRGHSSRRLESREQNHIRDLGIMELFENQGPWRICQVRSLMYLRQDAGVLACPIYFFLICSHVFSTKEALPFVLPQPLGLSRCLGISVSADKLRIQTSTSGRGSYCHDWRVWRVKEAMFWSILYATAFGCSASHQDTLAWQQSGWSRHKMHASEPWWVCRGV